MLIWNNIKAVSFSMAIIQNLEYTELQLKFKLRFGKMDCTLHITILLLLVCTGVLNGQLAGEFNIKNFIHTALLCAYIKHYHYERTLHIHIYAQLRDFDPN